MFGKADAKDSEHQKKKQKNNQETLKKKNKKTQKNKTKPDQPNNSDSGSIIDLREDSDAENAKINIRKNPNDKKKYDSILEFFGETFYPDKALVCLYFDISC